MNFKIVAAATKSDCIDLIKFIKEADKKGFALFQIIKIQEPKKHDDIFIFNLLMRKKNFFEKLFKL